MSTPPPSTSPHATSAYPGSIDGAAVKSAETDGLPQPDQTGLRSRIESPARRLLAWYVNKTFNGGMKELNRRLRDFLEANPQARVLDIGTGDGDLFLWWADAIGSKHLFALDAIPNRHTDRIATTLCPLDGPWPVASDSHDVILSSQNIEHIIDTPLYFHEAWRVLKPGGYFAILTENVASWANIGATICGWLPFSFTNMFGFPYGNKLIWHADLAKGSTDEMYRRRLWGVLGHQRLFSLYALGDLASKFGFEVEARFGGGYLPLFGGLSRVACRIDPWHAHFIGVKLRKPLSGGPCPGPYPPPPAP